MPENWYKRKCSGRMLIATVILHFQLVRALGVILAWDPSPDTNVTGYAIYYGTNSGNYPMRVDVVGNQTNATVPGLTNGATYYFVARAHTVEGVESLPSNEVSYVVPGGFKIGLSPGTNLTLLAFTVQASNAITLQASDNLNVWTNLVALHPTNNAAIQFVDPESAWRPQRFYRLVPGN